MNFPAPVTLAAQPLPLLPKFPRSWRYCNEWTWLDEAYRRYGAGRMVRHAEDCTCPPPTLVHVIKTTTIDESIYDTLKAKVDFTDTLL